jgi:hypothetical protein
MTTKTLQKTFRILWGKHFRPPTHSVSNSKAPVATEIVRKCAHGIQIAEDYSGLPSFFKKCLRGLPPRTFLLARLSRKPGGGTMFAATGGAKCRIYWDYG